jgi:hypothetical protein
MPRLCKVEFMESTWAWSDFVLSAAETKVLFGFDYDRTTVDYQ